MSTRLFIIVIGALLGGLSGFVWGAEPMPPGIDIRMTIVGPAFVDAQGMTLYQRGKVYGTGQSCSDRRETVRPGGGYNSAEGFPMRVPDAASWRSCAEKYPPLLAPADAKPVGHWTLHRREAGTLQWAYRGMPLHRSIKDHAPGDIHGWSPQGDRPIQEIGWGLAAAPLEAPAGIDIRLTSLGLVLANHEGKPLYYAASGKTIQNGEWRPALLPEAIRIDNLPSNWSVSVYKGGLRQWAWQGKPLYTYAHDTGDVKAPDAPRSQFVDVFGDLYGKPVAGWQAAILKTASAPPAGVHVKSVHPDFFRTNKIYADAQGKTLYAIHCVEGARDRLDCDDVGDSPRYWLSSCGGEERCRRDWKPFAAPKDAPSIDGLWAVALINPAHPFKPLTKGEPGLAIWTYRGRPVFTFAEDERPDDMLGEFDSLSTVMSALPIYAFSVP
jgi:predicted lipoprotein with Yx(FWY)xxD motif